MLSKTRDDPAMEAVWDMAARSAAAERPAL
jgi:hypothetical protein